LKGSVTYEPMANEKAIFDDASCHRHNPMKPMKLQPLKWFFDDVCCNMYIIWRSDKIVYSFDDVVFIALGIATVETNRDR
jgi:hypothetical protein